MSFKNLLILIVCTIALAGCSSTGFFSLDEVKEMVGVSSLPEQENYPEADAVTLCEYHNNYLKIMDNTVVSSENIHVVKKLFKNIEANSIVKILLSSGEKISNISARTISPDGKIKVLEENELYTSTTKTSTKGYEELKNITFTFPGLEKNCIIEYNFSIDKDYPFLYDSWDIQDKDPKLLNVYSLTVPKILILKESQGGAGWDWNFYFANCESVKPEVFKNVNSDGTLTGEMVSYTWTKREIPGIDVEPDMPPILNYTQQVKFAPNDFKSWNELTKWYYKKRFVPQMSSSSFISLLSKSLIKNCNNDAQKIDSIFKYVMGLKYVNANIMISGITPNTPEDIIKNGYADSKDKCNLLICLLRAANINAKPVLVRTSNLSTLNTEFPAWYFNYMIVKAELPNNRVCWLDASDPYAAAGDLPYQVEGVTALVINSDGTGNFIDLPQSMAKDNSIEYNINLAIDKNHDGIYTVNIKYKGECNSEMGRYFKDKTNKEIEEYCKKKVADHFLNAELSGSKFTLVNDSMPSSVLTFEMKVPGILKDQQGVLMLDYDPFQLFKNIKWLVKEKRNYPVQLDFPYQIKKYCEISFPEGLMKNLTQPKETGFNTPQFSYKKRFLNIGTDKLIVTEEAKFINKVIPTSYYPEVRNDLETINKKSAEQLIIKAN
jgi:hypothetical protein